MDARRVIARTARAAARVHPTPRQRLFLRNHVRKWCPQEPVVVNTREGFRMRVTPRDYESWSIYFYGEYDQSLTAVLKAYVREGATCWDVGAEGGWFALLFARIVGPAGHVDAFEAYPPNFARLQANVALNGFSWVRPHHVAVGDFGGRSWFVPPSDEVTGGVAYLRHCAGVGHLAAGPRPGAIQVDVVTLDEHAEATRPASLGLIKLDIEGAEAAALRGARATIERFRPVLAVEYNRGTARRAGTSLEELDELVAGLGYERYVFRGGLRKLRLAEWDGRTDQEAVFNVIGLPRR